MVSNILYDNDSWKIEYTNEATTMTTQNKMNVEKNERKKNDRKNRARDTQAAT